MITTLMKAKEQEVDISKLTVTALPFGTGNDFCNVTGWGKSADSAYLQNVETLTEELLFKSREDRIDIWDITVTFKDGGDIFAVDNGAFVAQNQPVYQRSMVNYFSLGMDAKIGTGKKELIVLDFEKNRTGNRCCNKCVYCLVGLKNFLCSSCCCCADTKIIDLLDYIKLCGKI